MELNNKKQRAAVNNEKAILVLNETRKWLSRDITCRNVGVLKKIHMKYMSDKGFYVNQASWIEPVKDTLNFNK